MFQDRFRPLIVLLVLADLALVLGAYLLAFWLRIGLSLPFFAETIPRDRFFEVDHLYVLLLGSQLALLYAFGLYDERLLSMQRARRFRLCMAAAVSQVLLLVSWRYFAAPLYLAQSSVLYFPRSVYVLFLLLNATAATAARGVFVTWLRHRIGGTRVALVGQGTNAQELIAEIRRRPETGLELVGIFAEQPPEPQYCGLPVLGNTAQLVEVVRQRRISEIIITNTEVSHQTLLQTIARSELTDARVYLVPGFYELLIGKVHRLHVHDIPLVEVLQQPDSPAYRVLKRAFDLVFALALGLALAPIALVVALLVRLGDRGPIFFAQERIGRGRKPFLLYKFRTMTPDAERATGPVLATPGDHRITPLGHWLRRFRLDEIPQLLNVLQGTMSLVGPRPERGFFIEKFEKEIPGYAERLKVKPGVTGLAQVRGTYETTAQNKLRYDLAYIYNQSLWLDLGILVDTVKEVLNSRGH